MAAKGSSAVLFSTRTSWNIFVGSILCMVSAGTVYFFPALGQGVSTHLGFTEGQTTAFLTAVNAGTVFGFLGGLMYKRAGSRLTTIFGACCNSFSYISLALLVRHRISDSFPIALLLSLSVGTSSHIVYTASMATAAAYFPKRQRGRILGLLSAVYGMSAGVCGVLQSAFFPGTLNTERLLFFLALLTCTPIAIAIFLFPRFASSASQRPSPASRRSEHTPLLPEQARHNAFRMRSASNMNSVYPRSDDRLIGLTYALAFAIAVNLQFGAYVGWTAAPEIPLPSFLASLGLKIGLSPAVKTENLCALILVLLLACFLLIPFGFRETSASESVASDGSGGSDVLVEEQDAVEPLALPFASVWCDFRFILMTATFFVLPGCGTISTLVQAAGVVASRNFPDFHNQVVPSNIGTQDVIGKAVSAMIIAFSSCNMMARLVAGFISDFGKTAKERESWKLRLLEGDMVLMCIATLGIAFGTSWHLILAVGLIGFAHGTFFALSPTQVSNWFGVDGFPLNFSIVGIGVFLASITVCSWIADVIAGFFMQTNWIDVSSSIANSSTQRFCSGLVCYAPTFSAVALLNCGLLAAYLLLHNRIVDASDRSSRASNAC